MIGRTISHYRILEKLGEGGMGVVYKAEDTKLRRAVALKFLPPELTRDAEAKARFIQEAQAASALDHANICTIHEIDETEDGQLFIAMTHCDGETLREKIKWGPLGTEAVLGIAMQIAHGLAKAHAQGIVHRDIKPANVIVTGDGVAKILDFGLAKLAGQVRLTRASSTIGTVAYMSPEQASGKDVDERSDIWSLGVVLFEMLTGRLPFKGDYEQAMVYSILNEAPLTVAALRPDAPKRLGNVVARALEKNPDERYRHIHEMIVDLEAVEKQLTKVAAPVADRPEARRNRARAAIIGIGIVAVAALIIGKFLIFAPHEGPISSVAVLPFQNMSTDPGQEYFSDGMTEAIIKELSQIKALRVISRTSVMQYKGTNKTVPQIAHELGVDAVVEGSVLRADHDVRITAQLIAAYPEKHIWADDFTRSIENVLVLQSEVARAIAREIKVTVTPAEQERMTQTRTVNPEANEAYLKGRFFARKDDPDDWYKSMQYFEEAIRKDSTYALAYTGVAEICDRLGSTGFLRPDDAWPKARAYAEKALALDPTLAEGVLQIADVKFIYEYDMKGAEEHFKRAIELDPNLAMAHFWYGWFLAGQSRYEEGIAELKRGVSLDPLWPRMMSGLVWTYAACGKCDSAFAYLHRMAEIDSNDAMIYLSKPFVYLRLGKYNEAIEMAGEGVARGITPCLEPLAVAYASSGKTEKARECLSELMEDTSGPLPSSVAIAEVYCALGDREKALEYFERAYQEHDTRLSSPGFVDPWCDFLRSDPRYVALLKKVGFEMPREVR
jgi:serine/threonine protein kinase/tetratricopeptide (TPR) repeat protein